MIGCDCITKHSSALYIGMAKVLPIIDVLGYDGQNSFLSQSRLMDSNCLWSCAMPTNPVAMVITKYSSTLHIRMDKVLSLIL